VNISAREVGNIREVFKQLEEVVGERRSLR
jgi:hypothetical protein